MNEEEKHIRRCQSLANCLQVIGETAIAALERGEIEDHPIKQIQKALSTLEQQYKEKMGRSFDEEARRHYERKQKTDDEGVVH